MKKHSLSRIGQAVTAMSGNNILKKAALLLTVFAGIGVIWTILWRDGAFLPHWIVWEEGYFHADEETYEIVLAQKKVRVLRDNILLWNSPENVKVQSVLSHDIDNDGKEELVLLCWKRGRFGKHKPFWIEKDETGWSQHIFVYEYDADTIKPKWMSSYIGQDVFKISADDSRASNPAFRKCLWLTAPDGQCSSWVWDSWGFVKEDTDVSFVVFGDNLIHEPIYRYGLQNGENFDFLYENIQDWIAQSDVAVINQETPLVNNPAMYSDYPRFGTPLQVGEAIVDAGFDVVTCATNHALDKGTDGIQTTKEFFDGHDVICLGIETADEKTQKSYEVLTRNGIRFALFNDTYGTNGIRIPEENPDMVHLLEDEDKIREDIAKAKSETDCILFFVHWGTEYAEEPDAFQEKWTQIFLECKVDVVVGTHPHILQPYTMLTGQDGHQMLVFYSIGNFISAQNEETCIKGGMAAFTVSRTPTGCRITESALHPLVITREDGRYTADCLLPLYSIPMGERGGEELISGIVLTEKENEKSHLKSMRYNISVSDKREERNCENYYERKNRHS